MDKKMNGQIDREVDMDEWMHKYINGQISKKWING